MHNGYSTQFFSPRNLIFLICHHTENNDLYCTRTQISPNCGQKVATNESRREDYGSYLCKDGDEKGDEKDE